MPAEKRKRNRRIKRLRKKGVTAREIARIYGVHPKTIWGILRGRNHKSANYWRKRRERLSTG